MVPFDVHTLPLGHDTHPPLSDEAVRPPGHSRQAVAPPDENHARPSLEGHAVQFPIAIAAPNVPGGHGEQTFEPSSANVPAKHFVQYGMLL
jgi:hypothetical protein